MGHRLACDSRPAGPSGTKPCNRIQQRYALANKGADAALAADKGFALGLNVKAGKITHPAVVEALNFPPH